MKVTAWILGFVLFTSVIFTLGYAVGDARSAVKCMEAQKK